MGAGNKKFQSKTRINYFSSVNNFLYHEVPGNEASPVYRNNNADYSYYGIMQEFYTRLKCNNFLSAKIWFQNKYQRIPPTASETQHEDFVRSLIELKVYKDKFDYVLRSAFLNNFMNYRNFKDEANPINSINRVSTFKNFADFNFSSWHNTNFLLSANIYYHRVETNNYNENKERKSFSISAGIRKILCEKLQLLTIIKQEIIDSRVIPVIPSLGMEYKVVQGNNLILKANFSRNFHAPSLNDLYWKDDGFSYGNPDLEPEEGYSGEAGLSFSNSENKKVDYSTEITGFYSVINKWFMWYPDENGKWFPQNLKKVARRGIESSAHLTYSPKNYVISFEGNYNFTVSTNEKATDKNDNSVGKQLTYIPRHTANSSLKISFKNYSVRYSFHYYGLRYTSSDNEKLLPAYLVSNVILEARKSAWRSDFSCQLAIENLFGKEYQLSLGYPMPGRCIRMIVRYDFNE